MSNDFRDRFKIVTGGQDRDPGDDLFSIWNEQKRMQAEDKKMSAELAEAKRKAKELKKSLRKHKFGEQKKDVTQKISGVANGLSSRATSFAIPMQVRNRRVLISATALLLLVVAVLGISRLSPSDDDKATLGESDTRVTIAEQDLPREIPQDFSLLFPSGLDENSYEVVRISPDNSDPSYTYLDRFTEGGTIFRVTQQEVPLNFSLEEVATNFQATNVIQVDETKVFHGYNERAGIQSIIFIKNDNLITIRSSEQFSDDQWASYVASLQ